MIPTDLLEILACPVCKAHVEIDEVASVLRCVVCKNNYPIQDGIPDMMPPRSSSE